MREKEKQYRESKNRRIRLIKADVEEMFHMNLEKPQEIVYDEM